MSASSLLELVERGLDLADRVERLSPIGVGVLAFQSLPQHTREKLVGDVCEWCREARSRCECCGDCGFSPCACPQRFADAPPHVQTIDVEGVAVE